MCAFVVADTSHGVGRRCDGDAVIQAEGVAENEQANANPPIVVVVTRIEVEFIGVDISPVIEKGDAQRLPYPERILEAAKTIGISPDGFARGDIARADIAVIEATEAIGPTEEEPVEERRVR